MLGQSEGETKARRAEVPLYGSNPGGGMPPLRDNWAELPAWTFQCDFPP